MKKIFLEFKILIKFLLVAFSIILISSLALSTEKNSSFILSSVLYLKWWFSIPLIYIQFILFIFYRFYSIFLSRYKFKKVVGKSIIILLSIISLQLFNYLYVAFFRNTIESIRSVSNEYSKYDSSEVDGTQYQGYRYLAHDHVNIENYRFLNDSIVVRKIRVFAPSMFWYFPISFYLRIPESEYIDTCKIKQDTIFYHYNIENIENVVFSVFYKKNDKLIIPDPIWYNSLKKQ